MSHIIYKIGIDLKTLLFVFNSGISRQVCETTNYNIVAFIGNFTWVNLLNNIKNGTDKKKPVSGNAK